MLIDQFRDVKPDCTTRVSRKFNLGSPEPLAISPCLGRAIDRGPALAIMLVGVFWTSIGLALL